jgi:N-methylhydantoinase B
MTKTADEVVFDFTGTDDQVTGPLNYPGGESYYAKTLGALFKTYAPDIVINDGVNRVIRCVVPDGTVLSPRYPAATMWRTWPMTRMLDAGMGALAKATGGRVPASSETITSYGLFGDNERGDFFLLREITGGGSGARPYADGVDTVSLVPGQKNMPAEFAETFYPIRIEAKGLRIDSGGIGRYRGGLGYWMDLRMLTSGTLLLANDRVRLHPWGVAGGGAGAPSVRMLNAGRPDERRLPAKDDTVRFAAGDVLRVLTPGGGGWGDPLERPVETVRLDVLRGFVSRERAYEEYGVVIDEAGGADADATEERRARLRTERGPLPLVDRGAGFREAVAAGDLELTTDDPVLAGTH